MRVRDLFEVEVGGGITLSDFPDDLPSKDLSSNQLDLFKSVPSGEPNLPENLKLRGRMGEFYVAERGPKPGEEQSKGARCFVWVLDGKAAAYVWLVPYSRENLNYPQEMHYKPELNGKGLRVSAVFVGEEFRGQKLAPKIYQWCLEHVCDYLMADSLQTPGGVAIWKYLRRLPQFAVEVWDGDRYQSRARKTGKDFNHVYNVNHLIPWVTLKSKLDFVLHGGDDIDEDADPTQTLAIQWEVPKACRAALESGEDAIVWVDVAKLDASFKHDRGFYVGPGGEGGIKGRYPRFDEWVKEGHPVAMPEVGFGYRDTATFTNGRHRFAWMRDHGAQAVPVVTDADRAEEFAKQFGTNLRRTAVR